ncbi:hypothetical protein HW555_006490 [Spodoptera exigua]|uniref:Mediator of RNA polymerase II transcription subunit 25 n=1 Tax=Spodoptera exigua TaxID=7107 RepID=A0A835L6F3_SPOEX|nr:hypothetical protein HW555_006490 [Spodoptera exigua]
MVVNAPDSPVQAEVIFVIEVTAANGAYIGELKTNYIIPTLEYFHGGALEEGGGNGSVYAIVTYKTSDVHPGIPVGTFGPFTCPQTVLETVDKIQFVGGHIESRACMTEALATALDCFDDLGRTDLPMHLLLLCCSPPYSAYGGGLVPPGAPATMEQAARMLAERGVQVSIASARRFQQLHALYENAGGELHQAQQRNYAKDPRHLVLLRGYSLKERPPSPAPPPVPDIQADVYGQGRGQAGPARPGAPNFPRPAVAAATGVGPVGNVAGVPGVAGVGTAACGRGAGNWLAPPRGPLYANNSALLTQLAQPSYPPPPPPPAQTGHQRMPTMVTPGPSGTQLQRSYIWSGVIEWMEKGKTAGDQKTTKHLPCQVDTWPSKLLMQLMPKQLISNIGGQYLKDSKSVLFHLQPSEALDSLTKVMVNGFAGCVHFSPMPTPPQCDIKVLILLYTPDKKAYLGFIPNNQATFVDRLRKFTISQHDDEGTMGKCVEINDLPRHKRMRSESNEGEGEVDEEGFITVNRRPKRLIRSSSKNSEPQIEVHTHTEENSNKFEVCITSKEPLPKQIALAKMMRKYNIEDIHRIKYKSNFKVLILFDSQEKANILLNCKEIAELGLRSQMTFELSVSYGIIKQIDLETEMEELRNMFKCNTEIISILRLKRLNDDGNWVDSETIRICFKGPTLPPYVYAYGCRFKVEPYTFPVSQCSGCWKYGHIRKYCPGKKILCPKCGKNHTNCETKVFKCVNCDGPHMSFDKTCPIFQKEKEIRNVMCKEACSYKKALELLSKNKRIIPKRRANEGNDLDLLEQTQSHQSKSYRDILLQSNMPVTLMDEKRNDEESETVLTEEGEEQNGRTLQKKKKTRKNLTTNRDQDIDLLNMEGINNNIVENQNHDKKEESKKNTFKIIFLRLVQKIKQIVTSNTNVEDKVKCFCKMIFEEIYAYAVDFIKDGELIKRIFSDSTAKDQSDHQQTAVTSRRSGAMPTAGMSSGGMGSGMSAGMQSVPVGNVPGVGNVGNVGQMSGPGPSQGMVQSQMQQHPQGMMIGGAIGQQVQQVGGKGPRPVTQLDGLEAARQQNLEKIQHLQQTLEAAHQQEAQFKSQMDIMSHLHAAQQQEQHYKQLEEQRKHQLQQQLQQQLRGAGGAAHPPRIIRPLLPSNPGLRHLLQQQPQYRPGGGAPRPASQPQQFDDVNNYSDFI